MSLSSFQHQLTIDNHSERIVSIMKHLQVILIVFSFGILNNVCRGQECAFPEDLIKPCSCFYRFIRCSGSKITSESVASMFRRLSDQLPAHEHRLDSFELINSAVTSVSPRMFAKFQIKNYFRLRGNNIANFSIGDFNELFALDISSNKFSQFDSNTFFGLRDLRVLNAANIGFKRLRKEFFSHLRNLDRLILSGNGIEHLDIDAFTSEYENNFVLSRIDLSSNRLTGLPDNVFAVLRQPEVIDLSNNRLKQINQIFTFSPDMTQFEPIKISLANNSLTNEQFDAKTFNRLLNRDTSIDLDLSFNQIRTIDSKVFQKLLTNIENSGKSRIDLSNNPIDCLNCAHRWLFEDSPNGSGKVNHKIRLSSCNDTRKQFAALSLADYSKCSRRRRAQK